MTESDKQEILDAVTATIKTVVNGKIDRMDAKMDLHIEATALFRNEVTSFHDEVTLKLTSLDPVIEGMSTIKNGRSFLVWIGVPLAVIGSLIALFR